MKTIRVKIVDPTNERRLLYVRDPELEPHLLYLRSSSEFKMVYRLNLDGGIVLIGADESKRLIDLEIRIPRSRWRISPLITWPEQLISGDIELKLKSTRYEADIPASAYCDKEYSMVSIQFGAQNDKPNWIALSSQCLASVAGDQLIGFFIRLVGAPEKTQ